MADHSADCGASYIDPDGVPNPKRCDCGADHDGHTINVGAVTVGKTLPPLDDPHPCSCRVCAAAREFNRMRAENTALAAALADIAGMLPTGDSEVVPEVWVATADCSNMGTRCCWEYLGQPDGGPEEWCPVCVAEIAWCAWKMGVRP